MNGARMIQQDAFLLWAKLSKNERDDRLAPLLMLEGEARASERKAILTAQSSAPLSAHIPRGREMDLHALHPAEASG